ncbi:hypothetical protein POTOM_003383 [Populus tomentosa]|uniref:Uncharacterized protein n=1 Tax=Populus tomentosa TaxID=118781 RepID=A0A8X8J038_POPTO|nr:hypothetical protein POTOM_003383 [Populus tomentosa]
MDFSSASASPLCRSPRRTRSRRWRQSRTCTAVVVVAALVITTTAWLSLVFSGTTARWCWHRLRNWEGSLHTLPWKPQSQNPNGVEEEDEDLSLEGIAPSLPLGRNRNLSEEERRRDGAGLALNHIVFGIAGSSQLWKRRKEFIRLWWRKDSSMRGHVWVEEQVDDKEWDESLPRIMISEDTSRFRYTNPTGHPSGLRIARVVLETFRLGLSDVRWFVLGDDDTIFSVDNLVDVLSKYDCNEMVYIGGPSESHSANTYFSHNMAYGGGGIAISYPLAKALYSVLDDCLERYHRLYGSDDRLHACISELGVPLSREHGFHQWDIRGSAHGLLSAHPISPFVSIHHVEAVEPIYPGMSSLDSLKLFTKAMKVDPMSFLQRSICYDHARRLTFSVSLGYAIQVFPSIVQPRVLERSEMTFSAWNKIHNLNEFDLDIRDPSKSVCKSPVLFFLEDVERQGNTTLSTYERAGRLKDDLKRKVLCFPRSVPLPYVGRIQALGYPLKNWHLSPRRLCCKLNQTSDELLTISVRQCGKGSFGSFADSV